MYTFCLLVIIMALFITVFNSQSVETLPSGTGIIKSFPYLSMEAANKTDSNKESYREQKTNQAKTNTVSETV